MCGLTVVVGHELSRNKMMNSLRSLSHRGPDGSGVFMDDDNKVYLGHARLSIIDLKSGSQPLIHPTRDIVLVCNGEIYGHEKIRSELAKKNHVFCTLSDSEVILHLYVEYGMDFLRHLRGEFSFVLYDVENSLIISARDRFGIKPLFYNESDDGFVFSSEAKGIFATGLVDPKIDPVEIRNTLSFALPDSVFSGVQQVKPGTYMVIHQELGKIKSVKTHSYWDIDLHRESPSRAFSSPCSSQQLKEKTLGEISLESAQQMVRTKVDEVVKIRLRSDVPVGVYLSGGIDSAAIAGTIAKYTKGDFHAFTVAFSDDKKFNELTLAREMAKSIGAKLHVVEATNEMLIENFEDSLWYSETPTGNLHGVGKFLLSKLAAKHVKVVLTGEGSDEIFLGYEYFKNPDNSISNNLQGRLQSVQASALKPMGGPHVEELEENLGFVPQSEMRKTFSKKMQKFLGSLFKKSLRSRIDSSHPIDNVLKRIDVNAIKSLSLVRKIQHFSIKGILTPYILSILGDRAEMSHSVEGRAPLLDHELFELARCIPDNMKIRGDTEKFVFREAMKDRVIDGIYSAKKWPFAAPPYLVRRSTGSSMASAMEKYLSKQAIQDGGIFDASSVRNLLFILKIMPFDSQIKRDLNSLLIFMMSVQALQSLYEAKFQKTIDERFVGKDLQVVDVSGELSARRFAIRFEKVQDLDSA